MTSVFAKIWKKLSVKFLLYKFWTWPVHTGVNSQTSPTIVTNFRRSPRNTSPVQIELHCWCWHVTQCCYSYRVLCFWGEPFCCKEGRSWIHSNHWLMGNGVTYHWHRCLTVWGSEIGTWHGGTNQATKPVTCCCKPPAWLILAAGLFLIVPPSCGKTSLTASLIL